MKTEDYRALRRALKTRNYTPLQGIASGLVDPLASYSNDLFGPEGSCTTLIRSPAELDSLEMATDMEELYAMAVVRDIPFSEWNSNPVIAQVATQLRRTPSSVFRQAVLPGPFVSQLQLAQPWKMLLRRDYLTNWESSDRVHSGKGKRPSVLEETPRYPVTLRDLASYTRSDYPVQAYQDAALWLQAHHPQSFYNPNTGAPYVGFLTFNLPFVLDLLNKASALALRVTWYHKWLVHCTARPEEVGAEVERLRSGLQAPYDGQPRGELTHSPIVNSIVDRYGTALLPQAYPEGCPTHPSFPAGHLTIAGACVTILKALTHWNYELRTPVVPSADGKALEEWKGGVLYLGAELNKLAYNSGESRMAAGVHFRHDNEASLELGEQVALRILHEVKGTLGRKDVKFTVHTFHNRIVIV